LDVFYSTDENDITAVLLWLEHRFAR
jgi:hypothetical protein